MSVVVIVLPLIDILSTVSTARPFIVPPSISTESRYAVPSIYKFLNSLVFATPRSTVLSAAGRSTVAVATIS